MNAEYKTLSCVLACLFLSGCVNVSAPVDKISYASRIGDLRSVSLGEVVVSVPVPDKPDQYQNIHVFFSAVIGSEKPSFDMYDVSDLIRRSCSRLSAVTVEKLLEFGPVSAKDLPSIRKNLISTAQQTFDSAFSKWTRAGGNLGTPY
jgi:hypothetical protein